MYMKLDAIKIIFLISYGNVVSLKKQNYCKINSLKCLNKNVQIIYKKTTRKKYSKTNYEFLKSINEKVINENMLLNNRKI